MGRVKIGVVYNPYSGDKARHADFLTILGKKCKNHTVYCTSYTREFIKEFFVNDLIAYDVPFIESWKHSFMAGKVLLDVDILIVLGGDGTIADVVRGQREAGRLIPILGIGIGTANSGPLINIKEPKELEEISFKELETMPIGGLDVYNKGGEFFGSGFNDIVFSDTLVSTLDGKKTTVDASMFVKGKKKEKEPSFIGKCDTKITINQYNIHIPFKIGQIILSPIYNKEKFIGKAIFGKLCWLPFSNKDASIIVSHAPLIKFIKDIKLEAHIPLYLAQFVFGEEDKVQISNTRGFAIIDGNPRINMEKESEVVTIRYNTRAAYTARRRIR